MEPLMDIIDAAKMLCVSPRTVWAMTRDGGLACVRIGRRVLYAPEDIQAFVDRSREGGDKLTSLEVD
jgi:excisionase family DNA binding protein